MRHSTIFLSVVACVYFLATGGAPSGPGYLSWLAGKSFNSSQFGSFAVNVVDDAISLRGHPHLPDSRVAFENNPTNIIIPQGGHGFLNAHIVGGFNDGSGAASVTRFRIDSGSAR
jgi:hypothetical protein